VTGDGEHGEQGPVDWLVVELRDGELTGGLTEAVVELVQRDLVRVLDLVVVDKGVDGAVATREVADPEAGELVGFRCLDPGLRPLLTVNDVANVAAALDPGTSAAVLVWEHRWAVPFARAVRDSGGQLVATGRLDPAR
jgi:hypothetical protein